MVDALERSETGEGVRPRVRARPQQVEVVAGGRHLGEAVRRQQGADQPGVALAQTERQAAVAARSHGRRGRQGAGPKAHHRRFPALVHGQQPIVRLPVPEREQQTTTTVSIPQSVPTGALRHILRSSIPWCRTELGRPVFVVHRVLLSCNRFE